MTKRMSIGKIRALQRASAADRIFTILAIDHQDSLRRALNSDLPRQVTEDDLVEFKQDVVGSIGQDCSGVLLDPVYGAGQAIASGMIPHSGLLVELEKADYNMEPLPLAVEILPDWSVAKIKRMGADGVKLFYYYNPYDEETAAKQDRQIEAVVAACREQDIPLYAEPIVYPYPQSNGLRNRRDLVIGAARRTAALGADVLKLEFPIDVSFEPDEAVWAEACRELTEAVEAPWVLLSAGADFQTFIRQVRVACRNGAAGFIAGRAVWGDACPIRERNLRRAWLENAGRKRMQQLVTTAQMYATPWSEHIQPEIVTASWYAEYSEARQGVRGQ